MHFLYGTRKLIFNAQLCSFDVMQFNLLHVNKLQQITSVLTSTPFFFSSSFSISILFIDLHKPKYLIFDCVCIIHGKKLVNKLFSVDKMEKNVHCQGQLSFLVSMYMDKVVFSGIFVVVLFAYKCCHIHRNMYWVNVTAAQRQCGRLCHLTQVFPSTCTTYAKMRLSKQEQEKKKRKNRRKMLTLFDWNTCYDC